MADLITDLLLKMVDAPAHRVYVRTRWSDDWVEVPYLYAANVHFALSPTLPHATLVYEYGQICRPDRDQIFEYPPLLLPDRVWVKVEIDQPDNSEGDARPPLVWYGRTHTENREQMGSVTGWARDLDSSTLEERTSRTGGQIFQCFGLEFDLDLAPVVTSYFRKASSADVEIGRAIAFNRGGGNRVTDTLAEGANMSKFNGDKVSRLFSEKLGADNADLWTAQEIALYLLKYHAPKDSSGNDVYDLDFNLDSQVEWLQWQKPTLDVHGRTVKQILDQLIDRRRLTGWWLSVEEGEGTGEPLKLNICSFNEDPIGLEDGTQLTANGFQYSLNFEEAFNIIACEVADSQIDTFELVIATGARRTSTFTIERLRESTDLLIANFDSGLIDGYNEAFSTDPSYATLDREEQQRKNAEVRAEERFERVFSYYGLKNDWNGLTSLGEPVNPILDNAGDPTNEPEPFWQPGIRFQRELPLKEHHDYSDDKIATGAVTNTIPAGQIAEYRALLFVVDFSDDDHSRVVRGDRVAEEFRAESSEKGGRSWSCSVRPQTDAAGIIVQISGGPQHKLEKPLFVALPEEDKDDLPDERGFVFVATVCWETDSYCQVQYPPPDEEIITLDAVRTLRIDLGDDYRLDYVAPHTLVDCKNSEAQFSDGGFVRDDRARMRDVCRIAHAWYAYPRRAIRLTYRGILHSVDIGDLINNVGDDEHPLTVNTIVTGVTYDLAEQVVMVQTDFAELDPVSFVRTV